VSRACADSWLRSVAAALLASSLAIVPRASEACAVCFVGNNDESRIAFLVTTGLLTLLPLLLLGGAFWWLRRRFAVLDRETEQLRAAPVPPAPLAKVGSGER